jgi:hypothetical protein
MHATRLLGFALLLTGCPDRTIAEVPVEQGTVEVKDVAAVPRNDVDILFVIDDSLSMRDEQASLRANFPRLVSVLETIQGGLPDVQIGVITPNLGASATDGTLGQAIGACNGQGESGQLRELAPGGPRFLQSFDDGAGGRTTNFAGTLGEAFSQLAAVGDQGCGIEQHLEAMKRATDGSNAVNAGFLRDGAYLAVIVIADEDDCSLARSTLLDGNQADPTYGDRVNFRCTSQGVACDSPATDFEAATGPREDCHPREGATELTLIDRYVDHLKGLKPDPRDVMVAGIVGNPEQFTIETRNGVTVLGNSCPTGSTQLALPAVRTADFASQFALSTNVSICNADLSEGLEAIGALIKDGLDDVCFDNDLLDVDPVTPGPQYECSVVEVRRRAGQPDEELRTLARCETGEFPCWRIEEDAAKCFYTDADPHLKLVIDYGGEIVGPDIHIKSQCVTTDSSGPVL